jgi:hypothetical protein
MKRKEGGIKLKMKFLKKSLKLKMYINKYEHMYVHACMYTNIIVKAHYVIIFKVL